MKFDQYKSFTKCSDNLFYCDLIYPFVSDNSNVYKYIIYLNGTFAKGDQEISFKAIISFSIIVDGTNSTIDSAVIKNISLSKNLFNKETLKKYLTNNNAVTDMFDVCSAEFEYDFESDICAFINTMFSTGSVTMSGNKFIINFKFKNNEDLSFKSLSMRLKENLTNSLDDKITKSDNVQTSTKINTFPEINSYCITIAIMSIFLILQSNNFSQVFDKSNILFFKLKKSFTKLIK